MSFRSKLAQAIREKDNTLCLGIDPHLDDPPPFLRALLAEGWEEAVQRWALSLFELAAPYLPAVKLQSAFFEAQGAVGMRLLAKLIKAAELRGLITILDAKRGDIASTMQAYGVFAFATMGADALTVQPYMGYDVVAPLSPWLRSGHGVYVVWLSSNPAGRLLQGQQDKDGRLLIASLLEHFIERMEEAGTIGALGLVAGATRLDELPGELLTKLCSYPLLMPGLGEQKAKLTLNLAKLLRESACPLLPVSRGLTGLGSHKLHPLREATTLPAYLSAFETTLQSLRQRWSLREPGARVHEQPRRQSKTGDEQPDEGPWP